MAATSHDFWLHNLTAPVLEDAAHVRLSAYALIRVHP